MRLSLFAAAALCASSLAAHADTLEAFSATGTFFSGATLSGTLTVDTTQGYVTAVDLSASSPDSLTFNSILQQQGGYDGLNLYYVVAAPNTASPLDFYLLFGSSSLVGYGGGPISVDPTNGADPNADEGSNIGGPGYNDDLEVGILAPIATTPEPSTIALLGTGMLGVAGVVRKRFA